MSKLLDTAIKAAKAAEEVILEHYGTDVVVETKYDESPVTVADRDSEHVIRDIIRDTFPTHGFLGEEHGREQGSDDYLWIIDPIDGTKNFTRGVPLFGTLIALMHNNELVLGVSNLPALHEMIYAEKGSGAYLGDKRLHVSNTMRLDEAYVAFGGLSRFEEKNKVKALIELEDMTRGHRGFGDCWMYHLLAKGNIDIVLEARINIWDIAAGAAIVTEAGGVCTDFQGNAIRADSTSMIACNGQFHDQLISMFSE